mmetsp:Transcript_32294/g.111661  ORF Transcript_32294/g.111661 Transcript_32294/m.111661 type:complete len:364 (-) Transcript_32294:38-1129(-)
MVGERRLGEGARDAVRVEVDLLHRRRGRVSRLGRRVAQRARELLQRRRALGGDLGGVDAADDGRADNDAVCHLRSLADVLRRRDAKAHGQRHAQVADRLAHALHEGLELLWQRAAAARDARDGDAVEHRLRPRGGQGEVAHARVRRRRGHEGREAEVRLFESLEHALEQGLLRGQVDDDEAIDTGGDRVGGELVEAVGAERVVVAHEDDGHGEAQLAGFRDGLEAALQAKALFERNLVADLDRGAVGHGVREGHAELDDVSAARLHRKHESGRLRASRVAAREVRDQRRAVLAARRVKGVDDAQPAAEGRLRGDGRGRRRRRQRRLRHGARALRRQRRGAGGEARRHEAHHGDHSTRADSCAT